MFRRLAALVYDAFLLFAITLGYGAVLLVIKMIAFGTEGLEDIQPNAFIQWLSFFGWIACLMSYYYICWRKQGQTLGMKAWRLRLQQANGDLATQSQCLKRCPMAFLSLAAAGFGYFYCLIPPHKSCAHDIFTHTQVVVLEKT
ncbi:RDD family protein [Porticoccaceae bacterium]|nr:RDD family protein [Porticoccaceae bacterium]